MAPMEVAVIHRCGLLFLKQNRIALRALVTAGPSTGIYCGDEILNGSIEGSGLLEVGGMSGLGQNHQACGGDGLLE